MRDEVRMEFVSGELRIKYRTMLRDSQTRWTKRGVFAARLAKPHYGKASPVGRQRVEHEAWDCVKLRRLWVVRPTPRLQTCGIR